MNCIYCEHPYTYALADKQQKCGKCKRKFSLRKLEREEILKKLFISGCNTRETSSETKMHFSTVQKHYEKFRRDIVLYADKMYRLNSHRVTGYNEYLYLPKSLKIEENIHKLQHFFTMSYDDKVYNIMMPHTRNIHYDSKDEQSKKLLLKYLKFDKVAKLSKAQNTITRFWEYFEKFICKFKGVSDEQFIYYLKESEWRFNTKGDV